MMDFLWRPTHPLRRLASTASRLPRYLRLAHLLMDEGELPPGRKALLGAALAYTVSPIDLVPGIIPVAGQLDDLAVLLLGVRQALGACAPPERDRFLLRAGLSEATLDDDLENVQGAAAWLVGKTASWGMRAVAGTLRSLAGAARRAGERAGDV
jgi:uncharacterized membrane protein YkvA (DUF1232 family)